jgi:hypothetical protein|nr:MAG TPA: Selenium binding protein, Selenium-Binding Protein [Caudoviricetes sp.]
MSRIILTFETLTNEKHYFMKKILALLLLSLSLISCSTYLPAPRSYIGFVDYAPFTEKGIFITESNSVSFNYEPIGSILVEETGGWGYKNPKIGNNKGSHNDDYLAPVFRSMAKKIYYPEKLQTAFDNLAIKLKELNANGIINLKISYYKEVDSKSKLLVGKIIVTGMAIKR